MSIMVNYSIVCIVFKYIYFISKNLKFLRSELTSMFGILKFQTITYIGGRRNNSLVLMGI